MAAQRQGFSLQAAVGLEDDPQNEELFNKIADANVSIFLWTYLKLIFKYRDHKMTSLNHHKKEVEELNQRVGAKVEDLVFSLVNTESDEFQLINTKSL